MKAAKPCVARARGGRWDGDACMPCVAARAAHGRGRSHTTRRSIGLPNTFGVIRQHKHVLLLVLKPAVAVAVIVWDVESVGYLLGLVPGTLPLVNKAIPGLPA